MEVQLDAASFRDEALEREALAELSLAEPNALLERFSTLVRESGSADERTAAEYIVSRLRALGVPTEVFTPDLFLSVPRRSELRIGGDAGSTIESRPPAFSLSTNGSEINGDVVYVPSKYASGTGTVFDMAEAAKGGGGASDPVRGRIVLTEGFSTPATVHGFERRGATALIFIHPGERIHAGICTTIWGAPSADSIARKPRVPVVCINHPDGEQLIRMAEAGAVRAAVRTWLDEGWMKCPLPVVEIRGAEDPDEFLLVHGHYDSWWVGIGDNATGDATLLELARVLNRIRGRLNRSIRIAWWPGHSTGRYAGSTWYADTFADDLDQYCIGQINIDSPGCAGATAYEEVMWMAEAGNLCTSAIADAVGEQAQRLRPLRAGDYSFNQIGLTGLYMLLSNIPIEERRRRGYYAVGGCGGNIAWHTPVDRMEVADPAIVERDLRIYLTTILRIVNAPMYPFDYSETLDEIIAAVQQYDAQADVPDLEPLLQDLKELRCEISRWQADGAARLRRGADPATRRDVNERLRRLARILVPLNYSRGERFDHDPAVKPGVVPRLETALQLPSAAPEAKPFLQTGLVRERNKLRAMIRAARRELK
jgi:peptidase M28-like protein